MCDFLASFDMNDFACWCMVPFVVGCIVFLDYDNGFQPSLSFSKCHGVLGCLSCF